MKKLFVFLALLAGIAVMTGCQKDQDVVTLKAVIDPDSKAFFGGNDLNLPYWDENDKVRVAGEGSDDNNYSSTFFSRSFGLNLISDYPTCATITGVPTRSVYCAIYPANIVDKIGSPSTSGTSAKIYYKPTQEYDLDEPNNRQRVNMPMGAVTTSTDKTFLFKNLCSILRVNITNALATNTAIDNVNFNVRKITVQTYGAYLAGYANVTLTESGEPDISMNSDQNSPNNNVLSFYRSGYQSMGTIDYDPESSDHSKYFDIVVPPFDASELVIEVELYNGNTPLGYFECTVENPPAVEINNIYPINLTVDRYTTYDYAYFLPGPEFNRAIRGLSGINGVTGISFNNSVGAIQEIEAGNTAYTYTTVHANNSPLPIYAYIHRDTPATLVINSRATFMYADTNCSYMFTNLPWDGYTNLGNLNNLQTIWWNNVDDYGVPCGFQTEDVTNMSYMFAGCPLLSNFSGIQNFNTTNVRDMSHMFEGCSGMMGGDNLSITSFDTRNLKNMSAMFKNCTNLTNLDINTFNTENVTDMSELFRGCTGMKNLHINNFDMTNVSNKSNMCLGLGENATFNVNSYERQNLCNIHCSLPTQTALRGSAPIWTTPAPGTPRTAFDEDYYNSFIDPTTGLNTIKIAWTLQGD